MLNFHNYYRCVHGTQPLVWDNGLAASAQEWAYNRMNSACVMQHSGYAKLGENVAAGTWRGLTGYNWWLSETDVVNAWYHEPFTYGSTASPTLNHFTQVVWHATTRVGCAWAACNASQYEFWVCQYTPQGNINSASIVNQNVPRPCRSQATCQSVLQGMNLMTKFQTQAKVDAAMIPNQITPATYNFGAQTCLTAFSAYTLPTVPMCITDSTVLPKNIDVTVQNPTSTGALTVSINCPSGQGISGTGLVTCLSGNVWNIAGSCGGTPVTAAPPPPAPATTKAPTSAPATKAPTAAPTGGKCYGNLLLNKYLYQYPTGYTPPATSTLAQAKAACNVLYDCGGVTFTGTRWEARKGTSGMASTSGEQSYRVVVCATSAEAEMSIQEKAPWLIPVVVLVGVFLIAIGVLLFKKRSRSRGYSGDLGTPEFPTMVPNKVEEEVLTSPTGVALIPLSTTDLSSPQVTSPVLQHQSTYSQVPTSPTTNQDASQIFPLPTGVVHQSSYSQIPTSPTGERDSSQVFSPSASPNRPTEMQAEIQDSTLAPEQIEAPITSGPQPQLSSDWETRTDPSSGNPYYYNHKTGVTQWEVPDGL